MEEYGSVFGQRFGTICQTKFNVESASVVSELHSLGLSNISASCLTKLNRFSFGHGYERSACFYLISQHRQIAE